MQKERLCGRMISISCWFLVICLVSEAVISNDKKQPYINEDGAQVVPMGKEEVEEMYRKWTQQGVSSVIAAIANNKLKKHRARVRDAFGRCTKDAKDINMQAICVQRLENGDFSPILDFGKNKGRTRLDRLKHSAPQRLQRLNRLKNAQKSSAWVGNFRTSRAKRSPRVRISPNYRLFRSRGDNTPFGAVARNLLKSVLGLKHKEKFERWEDVVEQAKNLNKESSKIFVQKADSDENLDDPMKFKHIATSYERQKGGNMMELTRKLSQLGDIDEQDPRAQHLLRDIVAEHKGRPNARTAEEKLANLLKDGLKLGYSLAGHNTTDFDEKSLRIASPRFLSLMPEQESNNEIELASPSLLSLHNQGRGIENLTSLPNLLHGINEQDRQAWLDLIVEASGVTDQLKDLAENLDRMNGTFEDGFEGYRRRGKRADGMPLYFTKENVTKIYGEEGHKNLEHWDGLNRMFTKAQLKEMNSTGFAVLTPAQQQYMYGASSPYANPEALRRFRNLSADDVHNELAVNVRTLSRPGSRLDSRLHDIILAPVSFTWVVDTFNVGSSTILSPVSFSPSILSPVVFGPMILSPWIFSPLILSPKLMSPLILAPYIFSPLILSPLVLHPQILSPGVFCPHILVPFLLSPLILTPQVFCPLILSPLVMAPVIANPSVGSPKVLSPFVLSPALYSPQALSGLVLSPYALSPLFFSKVFFFRLILSPSWLS